MAKKKINENKMLSELSESSFFSPGDAEEADSTAQQSVDLADDALVDNAVDSGVDSQAGRPVDQSTDEETSQQIEDATGSTIHKASAKQNAPPTRKTDTRKGARGNNRQFDNSPILSRPKSFYISKNQDADIDDIVDRVTERLEGKIAHKIDRSVVMRLILESNDWTSDEAIDLLAKHLVNKLVSQLVD